MQDMKMFDVCLELEIPYHTLLKARTMGLIPDKRRYSDDDFPAILEWWNKQQIRASKPYSTANLLKQVGISHTTFAWHIAKGNVKRIKCEQDFNDALAFFKNLEAMRKKYFLLCSGIREVGGTKLEIGWVNGHRHLLPEPVIHGNNLRNRYYTAKQLKDILALCRKERAKDTFRHRKGKEK